MGRPAGATIDVAPRDPLVARVMLASTTVTKSTTRRSFTRVLLGINPIRRALLLRSLGATHFRNYSTTVRSGVEYYFRVTIDFALDAAPAPLTLSARTETRYALPLAKLLTLIDFAPRASEIHLEPPLNEYWYDVIAAPLDDGARTTSAKPPTNADSVAIVARPGTLDVVEAPAVT